MATPVEFIHDKHYYQPPQELPPGFLEIVQPLASWMMKELVTAYDNGYSTGRMDAARIEVMKMERIKVDGSKKSGHCDFTS